MTISTYDVGTVLTALGENSAAIAETLANKGIVGRRYSGDGCPLANYLTQQFPGAVVAVTRDAFSIVTEKYNVGSMPEACRDFVTLFDAGCYPALIERGTWDADVWDACQGGANHADD